MCVAGFFCWFGHHSETGRPKILFHLIFFLHLPSRQRYGYGMSARTLTCRISYIGIFLPEAQHIPMQIHQTLYHRSMVILTWNRNGRTWRLERSRLLISLCWSFPSPTHSLDFFFYSSPVFVEGMHSTMAMCMRCWSILKCLSWARSHLSLSSFKNNHNHNHNNNNTTCIQWWSEGEKPSQYSADSPLSSLDCLDRLMLHRNDNINCTASSRPSRRDGIQLRHTYTTQYKLDLSRLVNQRWRDIRCWIFFSFWQRRR